MAHGGALLKGEQGTLCAHPTCAHQQGNLCNTSLSMGLHFLWVPCCWHTPASAGTHLPVCPESTGEKQGFPSNSSQWEDRQGWWHVREPPSQPARGFSSKTRPPAHPGRFHQLVPFARAQLITPKSGAKTTGDHSSACGFLPYLWLSAGAWKDGSESENTPGSTGALFLALWKISVMKIYTSIPSCMGLRGICHLIQKGRIDLKKGTKTDHILLQSYKPPTPL